MKKLMICIFALQLVFYLPAVLSAEEWEQIGPYGGSFIGSVSDPWDPDVMTAVTTYPSPSKVYRTMDGGQNWIQVGEIPVNYFYGFSAYDTSIMYALNSYGCHYSTDGGVSWGYGPFPAGSGFGKAVCADPVDPNTVHACGYTNSGGSYSLTYFKSTDHGQTWTASTASPDYMIPFCIDVSKTDTNIIYICGQKLQGSIYVPALFQTLNGGNLWVDISSAVDTTVNNTLSSVAVDPTDHNNVYASGNGFYRSTDGGVTWRKNTTHLFSGEAIGIDPVNSANLYVTGGQNVFVSSDQGKRFTVHECLNGFGSHVDVAEADPSIIYVTATHGGLYKSTDYGATWNPAHTGITSASIASLEVAPSQPETVFFDIDDAYTLTATYDCGDTLQEVTYPDGCSGTILDLLVDSQDADKVIALEAG